MRNRLFFILTLVFVCPVQAEERTPLEIVAGKSKAVVGVQALNAGTYAHKPQGIFDKATGQILIIRKLRRAAYAQGGSGAVIHPSGIIVTNAHTVRGANGVMAALYDGSNLPVKNVSFVPDSDIAFLHIDPPENLATLEFANSDELKEGDEVYVLGHSERMKNSITGGKIVRLVRERIGESEHVTVLQTDFSAYKGDSGSPILDKNGKLAGIITAGTGHGGNLTFAIASNMLAAGYNYFAKNNPPPAEESPQTVAA